MKLQREGKEAPDQRITEDISSWSKESYLYEMKCFDILHQEIECYEHEQGRYLRVSLLLKRQLLHSSQVDHKKALMNCFQIMPFLPLKGGSRTRDRSCEMFPGKTRLQLKARRM